VQEIDEQLAVFVERSDAAIGKYLDALPVGNFARVRYIEVALYGVTTCANVEEIIVVELPAGADLLRRQMVNVECGAQPIPLLAAETKHAPKAEFVAQPLSI
jgi:hypothetical protein